MDFGLSEEQRLLEESLRRYLGENAPTARVRAISKTADAHDDALWKSLAELGVPGVLVPPQHGGSGLGMLDAAVIARELGYAATPAPFLGSAVMAPVALLASPASRAAGEWLPRLARGEARIGVAAGDAVAAARDGDRVSGRTLFALDAAGADAFLVASADGSLALVPRDASGLSIEALRTVDETRRLAALTLEGVAAAAWLGPLARARMLEAGRIALAADVLGACDRMLAMAVAYAGQRKQFGRVIGSFQAVKHMCAEMVAALEPARALVWYAAHAFEAEPEQSELHALLAKAHLAEVGTMVAKTATEVHGGIGFTDEADLHLWFKRIALDRQLLGGPEQLRAAAARLQGWLAG
jgi:alkylation response protein AidB-like acyl-CoA dehydrogenase